LKTGKNLSVLLKSKKGGRGPNKRKPHPTVKFPENESVDFLCEDSITKSGKLDAHSVVKKRRPVLYQEGVM